MSFLELETWSIEFTTDLILFADSTLIDRRGFLQEPSLENCFPQVGRELIVTFKTSLKIGADNTVRKLADQYLDCASIHKMNTFGNLRSQCATELDTLADCDFINDVNLFVCRKLNEVLKKEKSVNVLTGRNHNHYQTKWRKNWKFRLQHKLHKETVIHENSTVQTSPIGSQSSDLD